VARFLNNNDTGKRFISRYGVETQRAAAVLLHTLPGIPVVYMGDEIGAEFEPYEDPAPLVWQDPHHLRPLYTRLAQLRGTVPALKAGSFTQLALPKAPGAYAFVRDAGAQGAALVAAHFGRAGKFTLELPASLRKAGTLTDALTGAEVPVAAGQTSVTLELGKASALVLLPKAPR
jgi:glycosidase